MEFVSSYQVFVRKQERMRQRAAEAAALDRAEDIDWELLDQRKAHLREIPPPFSPPHSPYISLFDRYFAAHKKECMVARKKKSKERKKKE